MNRENPNLSDPRTQDGWSPIYAPSSLHDVITPRMCEETIRIATGIGFERSHIYQDEGSGDLPEHRSSESVWIKPDDYPELYREIGNTLQEMNKKLYRFSIWGMNMIQIIRYEPGSFFTDHVDIGYADSANRKISLVVQLSNSEDYEGGDLVFASDLEVPRQRGYGCVFPSWVLHRVEKITRGTRYSLAAWAKGKYFF